jgi:hypothetical protein
LPGFKTILLISRIVVYGVGQKRKCLIRELLARPGIFVWWRWRESNPRPKSSTQNDYKLSRSLGLAFSDSIDTVENAEPLAYASWMIVNGVAIIAPQLGFAQRAPFGGERAWTSQR